MMTTSHRVVSRDEWLTARKAHLEKEKQLTRQLDELRRERRQLPWVRVEKAYVFDAPGGKVTLADLFDGRSQLLVQHFMFGPGWKEGCDGCSFLSDHLDSARMHFEQADLSFAAVSRAPIGELLPFKRRMGWEFAWVSSHGSDFNHDFGVSFSEEQVARGEAFYNYHPTKHVGEAHGHSVFVRDDAGAIYHTYSTYARGAEMALGAFMLLDMVPKGRNETSTMSWVRLHDQYEPRRPFAQAKSDACCHGNGVGA